MFDTPVIVVYVPQGSLSALQACAVPALRAHQHDDVLPDLPEGTELLPQYTLLRPAAEWSEGTVSWTGDAAGCFEPAQQHTGLVVTMSYCSRQLTSAAGVLQIRGSGYNRFPWHPICQHISARGCSVSPAQLHEAAARGKARLHSQQQQQQCVPAKWWPTQLVPVALVDEQPFLHDLATAIHAHNLRVLQQQQQQQLQEEVPAAPQQQWRQLPPLIVPLLQQTVQRTAPAVAVQAAWRSHSSRLQHNIAERLLFNRAATAIQRAWHAFVLRSRLAMLSVAARTYQHAQTQLRFSCIMCVDVAGVRLLEAAAERCRSSSALFPEHRLWFTIEPEGGDLFLIESSDSSDGSSSDSDAAEEAGSRLSSSSSSSSSPVRQGLPAWLGADIPTLPADCSVAAGAVSRAHLTQLLELCCSVKDLLDPRRIQAGRCSSHDVAQLVTFRSKQQAAQRAALLAAYTYDVRTRQYTRLMTVQESPLGAAYRNLTGLSTTKTVQQQSSSSAGTSSLQQLTAEAAAAAAAATPALTSSSGGSTAATAAAATRTAVPGHVKQPSTAAAAAAAAGGQASSVGATGRRLHRLRGKAAAISADEHNLSIPPAPGQAAKAAGSAVPALAAFDAQAAASGATSGTAVHSTTSSPRTLGYAVPLQRIKPTDTLLAAAADTVGGAVGAAGATDAAAASSTGLQFHISVLHRSPHLLKELQAAAAAAAADEQEASSRPYQAHLQPQDMQAAEAAAATAGDPCSSSAGDEAHCVSAQPPVILKGTWDVNSLGAYLEQTKLQQVDAFKAKLAAEAELAAAAATAEGLTRQAAVAAAKAPADDSEAQGKAPVLLNTSSCPAPNYWPDTTADTTALAQALRQAAEQEAAARRAALTEQQQLAAAEARQMEQERQAAVTAAAQADKQALQWRHQQEQHQHQASRQHRAGTLRHVRAAAAAARHTKQQAAAPFAAECNKLSKYMRNHVAHRSKAEEQVAAAQHVQQQRDAAELGAATLQHFRHEALSDARELVLQQQLQADADLAAVHDIQQLEEAAKRAAAAAIRHHERSRAVWTAQLQQQD